jgi:hypothetical protein
LRLAEQQAVRLLTASAGTIAAVTSTEHTVRGSAGDAREVVSETARAAVTVPVVNAPTESSTIPAFHSPAVAPEWNAEPVAKMDEEEITDFTRTAAVSVGEFRGTDLEPGRLVTADMGPDIDALDQDVSRFFTHLGTQALQWFSWSNVTDIGSWLAAGMAVAGAFELARRSSRKGNRLAGVSADGQSSPFDFHSSSDEP